MKNLVEGMKNQQTSLTNIEALSFQTSLQKKEYQSQLLIQQNSQDKLSLDSQSTIKNSKFQSIKCLKSSNSLLQQQCEQVMVKEDIESLKKVFSQLRQFKIDKLNKVKLVSPSRRLLIQTLMLWKKRGIKDPNYNINLYLEKLNDLTDRQFILQQTRFMASVKLFIDNQQILNQKPKHFIFEDSYYEGVQDQYMMISSKNTDQNKIFEGQVKHIKPNGNGILQIHLKGKFYSQYFGNFVDGKKQGQGKQTLTKGLIYQGQFKNDLKHGKGVQTLMKKRKNPQPGQQKHVLKNRYQGHFQFGFRSGQGIQKTNHGQYTGNWSQGLKNGIGQMKYKNGHTYKGSWRNNSFHGQGVYTQLLQINGQQKNIYTGQFKDGYYDGQGVMQYAIGDKYQGQWAMNKKSGYGMYNYADGDYYDGHWQKDSAQGTGAACFGGKFYDGQFHLGLKHGLGQQTDDDGNTLKAIWENNQIIKKLEINGQIVDQE